MEPLLFSGSSTLSFYVNGTAINVSDPHPRWTLLDFIRSQDGLKGTKLGCGEGGCGACTVVLQTRDRNKRLRHLAVNACLYPLIGVAGKHVITIEGLGTVDAPHPLQERIVKLHASQCGFCTPGIVMSLYAVIRNAFDADTGTFKLSADDIESKGHLDGNLCRCTGYKPIFQAAKTFITEDLRASISIEPSQLLGSSEAVEQDYTDSASSASRSGTSGSCGRPGGCCKDSPGSPCGSFSDSTDITTPSSSLEKQIEFIPYVPHTELIYPPRLSKFEPKLLCYGNETQAWVKPTTVAETLDILSRFPAATLVTGASEVQVDVRFKDLSIPISVFIGDIPELTPITWSEDGQTLNVGGTATLSDLEAECLKYIPQYTSSNPGYSSALSTIAKTLRYFAGRQIRNAASLAGNIATASPISDMNPVLLALDAKVHALSSQGEEIIIPMTSMFKGYRKTALQPASLITKISIPMPSSDTIDIIKSYKQAKRKDDDIAIVTAAFRLRLSPPFSSGEDHIISSITLAFGGMAPTTVLAGKTSAALMNKPWNESTLSLALDSLLTEFPLPYSVPGGMASYRRTLTLSLFTRFYHHINAILNHAHPAAARSTMPDPTSDTLGYSPDNSASTEIHRHLSSGARDSNNPTAQRVVGQALPHLSGLKHATGEAEYLDDTAPLHRELNGALVLSQRAHAKLVSVDWTPAVGPGLALGYVDHTSLPAERNHWGPVVHDEPIFASGEVLAHGQIIGMVYAESALVAQEAAKRVEVGYEELPAILTIDEAIAVESFFPHGKELRKGADPKDIPGIIDQCQFSLSGTSRIGGQEHFYLETNAALAVPGKEDGSIEVWSSTQNTIETQDFVSSALGIPRHKINARVRRMGGAFGGKESRSVPIATIAALAAQKTKRPVRIMLNRDEDMMTSGQRHPMQCRWRVGFNSSGMLMALFADVYNNAGYSSDMSNAVMDRCLTHLDNCYYVPNAHFRGWVCRTNTHSNTAFRGFGGPQAMYFTESIVYAVAEELGMDVDEVRRRNLYEIGQLTPFHQVIDEDWHVPILLEQVRQEAMYDERRREIQHFNTRHQYRKRGICLVPTKFGISFATALHLNQAGASVKMYTDGSVLLNHGGTEMGQGLYTKMVQVAAQELGISVDRVYTEDTSSYQTANASPTAASSGSDLNGMAIKHACDQLNERLKPYREKFGPDADMATIAKAAYRDRVNLAAAGFYKMPTIGHEWGNYDPETQKPMYFYFTQGVACTEVELDLLTGDHTVLRTDIKMDVGRSINPAIDYGQIEGAFVQGQGLFTMEESLWTRSGQLATRGPGAYKIPGFCDIPQEFNVSFLKGVGWKTLRSIQSSKGIGEPPLFLGSTVLFALRDALNAARRDNGVAERLVLDSPATAERLRLGVRDELVERARVEPKDCERGFFVTVA